LLAELLSQHQSRPKRAAFSVLDCATFTHGGLVTDPENSSLPAQPPARARRPLKKSQEFPKWAPVAGFALLVLSIFFLMALILLKINVDCNQRGLVVFIIALTVAGAIGFLSGTASVEGKIPFFKDSPVTIATTGAIAALIIVILIGFNVYAGTSNCPGTSSGGDIPEKPVDKPAVVETPIAVSNPIDPKNTVSAYDCKYLISAGEADKNAAVLKIENEKVDIPNAGKPFVVVLKAFDVGTQYSNLFWYVEPSDSLVIFQNFTLDSEHVAYELSYIQSRYLPVSDATFARFLSRHSLSLPNCETSKIGAFLLQE
jgi:hypothetical protein